MRDERYTGSRRLPLDPRCSKPMPTKSALVTNALFVAGIMNALRTLA
jgi:hypothetical protein